MATNTGHAHEPVRTDLAARLPAWGKHRKTVRHHRYLPWFPRLWRQAPHLGRSLGLMTGAEWARQLWLSGWLILRFRHRVRPQAAFGSDHDPVAGARVLPQF